MQIEQESIIGAQIEPDNCFLEFARAKKYKYLNKTDVLRAIGTRDIDPDAKAILNSFLLSNDFNKRYMDVALFINACIYTKEELAKLNEAKAISGNKYVYKQKQPRL